MPYFIILPLWCVALVLLVGAAVTTRVVHRLRPAYPFAWRILLWSSAGFVVANLLAVALIVVAARVAGSFDPPSQAAGVILGAVLLLAPIIGSGIGFVAGAGIGAWFAYRARPTRRSTV